MKKLILIGLVLIMAGCSAESQHRKVCMGGVVYWQNIWDGHLTVAMNQDSTVQKCASK